MSADLYTLMHLRTQRALKTIFQSRYNRTCVLIHDYRHHDLHWAVCVLLIVISICQIAQRAFRRQGHEGTISCHLAARSQQLAANGQQPAASRQQSAASRAWRPRAARRVLLLLQLLQLLPLPVPVPLVLLLPVPPTITSTTTITTATTITSTTINTAIATTTTS